MCKKRCCAKTKSGLRCKIKGGDRCYIHSTDTCSICLDKCNRKVKLKCNHSFCKSCIYNWFIVNDTCPNCRTECLYSELADAYNYLNLMVVYSYEFWFDSLQFPEFKEYLSGFNLNSWMDHSNFNIIKAFIRLDDHMFYIYSNYVILLMNAELMSTSGYTGILNDCCGIKYSKRYSVVY